MKNLICPHCGKKYAELKSCPFCGGKAIMIDHDEQLEAEIRCEKCNASIYRSNTDKGNWVRNCITAWNRRIKE